MIVKRLFVLVVEPVGVEPTSRTRKPYAFYTLRFDWIFERRQGSNQTSSRTLGVVSHRALTPSARPALRFDAP